jgi:hypothetical protein
MPFYETIFENGSHSVAEYDSDDQAMQAISEHHRRATAGERGNPEDPTGKIKAQPAARIARVLVYDTHPVEHAVVVTTEDVVKAVTANAVGDMVDPLVAAAAVRDLTSPLVESGPHESNYKQEEGRELEGWEVNA